MSFQQYCVITHFDFIEVVYKKIISWVISTAHD